MNWPYFLFMNALGGISWVLLLGGGAYFFGEQMKRVVGPVQLLLLVAAIVLAAGGSAGRCDSGRCTRLRRAFAQKGLDAKRGCAQSRSPAFRNEL